MNIICQFCKGKNLRSKYKYRDPAHPDESNKFFGLNASIITCNDCEISYCADVTKKNLDLYYKSIYLDKKQRLHRFAEFNSRFFSQVIYYINHFKLFKNIKVLEIGPNKLGILPSLKIFQNLIQYFYYDQTDIYLKGENITKLGNYWDPIKDKLPNVDLIWMSHSLEHIHPNDLILILEKFYESLSNNGKIFIEIPNDLKSSTFKVPHTLFFSRNGLVKIFKKIGFKIIAISELHDHEDIEKRNFQNRHEINDKNKKKNNLVISIYLFFQKFLPNKFVKKIAFKHFVLNGPYTNLPIIRMIVQK